MPDSTQFNQQGQSVQRLREIEASRHQFQVFMLTQGFEESDLGLCLAFPGSYSHHAIQAAWLAWQEQISQLSTTEQRVRELEEGQKELIALAFRLNLAVRNCREMARKNKNRDDWARITKFVEDAIGKPSILRDALSTPGKNSEEEK